MRLNQAINLSHARGFARKVLLASILFALVPAAWAGQARKVAVETIQFKSDLIGRVLPYNVLLPVGYAESNRRYPVLFLLHGLFGRYDDWITRTNLAEYAAKYDVIVVMPEGHDNWYTDSATVPADKYESYFIKELISDVDTRLRTIKDRRARGVAGLSMGGFGAFKFALKHPNVFAFAGSMSGAFDPTIRTAERPSFGWNILGPSINAVFGPSNSLTRKTNDLHEIVRNVSPSQIPALPYLYFDCGLDDDWIVTNRQLADILSAKKIPHQYRQLPGAHSWTYWDQQVREVLKLFAHLMATNAPNSD